MTCKLFSNYSTCINKVCMNLKKKRLSTSVRLQMQRAALRFRKAPFGNSNIVFFAIKTSEVFL